LVNFWTHTAVRENSIEIYGFETETELHIFELLISVSGVGPKSGLAIIGIAGVNAIEEAVVNKDISGLTKISGIGKKTAEKIVLELNGKVFRSSKESTNLSENI
jgi:Holliday junction DNA helicase RuvA